MNIQIARQFTVSLLMTNSKTLIVTLLVLAMAGTIPIQKVIAGPENAKLIASDAAQGDSFGRSVSISGNTVIVGVDGDDDACPSQRSCNTGSAYIFVRSNGIWVQQQKLTGSDAASGDFFGRTVAISGDTVIVGAVGDDDVGGTGNSGAAYIFTRSDGVWSEQQKLTASDAETRDDFGNSVSISGDTVIVGVANDDDACPSQGFCNSGSAYIFTRSGGVWTEQQKLTASDAAERDGFGTSVSISGDTAIVGAGNDDDVGESSGSAYIFTRSDGVWTEQQKIVASDAAQGDVFGRAVSISDDTAIVGAGGNDDAGEGSGSAYIFTRSDGVWTEQQKLTASDAAERDGFGISVSISGDAAIVGASGDDDACPSAIFCDSGSAYIFTRSDGVWTEQQKLTASDAAERDGFGGSVSVSGNTALVGALGNLTSGGFTGSAYLFDISADAVPPVITGPDDITVDATGPDGAIVNFVVTAEDDVDGTIIPDCTPSSGSIFPTGSNLVTCTATDSDGNEATTVSFFVRVVQDVVAPLRFNPIADATIKFNSSTENFGALRKVETDNSPMMDFLMKFDVSGIGDRNVLNAKLRLLCTNGSTHGGEFHRVVNDWMEDSVTWDNAPPAVPEVIASLGPVMRNTWVEVDVTPLLITGDGLHSLRVMSTSSNGADYRSREKEELAPELVITLGDRLTILPTDDATVKLDLPTENFGAIREIEVDADSQKNFLMKFDVSGIGTRKVSNAILRLFCTNGSSHGGNFREIDNDWSEGTVTWENAPLADPNMIATPGSVVRLTWVEVDLSSLITGDGIYSLRVDSTSSNGADYRSKEKPGFEPELIITALEQSGIPGDVADDCTLRGPGVDLHGCDLSGADLRTVNLSGANLSLVDLTDADLLDADLSVANLAFTDLSGAFAFCCGANFFGANLPGANLSGADLEATNFSGTNLPGADLTKTNFQEAFFVDAVLAGANLKGVIFRGANLAGADLFRTDLTDADFLDAHLPGANLAFANLAGADFCDANLAGADLSGADLSGANLSGTNLTDTTFTGCTGTPTGTPRVGTLPTCL